MEEYRKKEIQEHWDRQEEYRKKKYKSIETDRKSIEEKKKYKSIETVQQAKEQLQGHIAYYENFNDHGRVLHLRRIIYATFDEGGSGHV